MIAVLSDIRGNLPALEAVAADARAAGATRFVNLGDSLSGPLWPAETADLLMREDWPTIAGNHERQLLTHSRDRMNASDRFARERLSGIQMAWLAAQPQTLTVLPASVPGSIVRQALDKRLDDCTSRRCKSRHGGRDDRGERNPAGPRQRAQRCRAPDP